MNRLRILATVGAAGALIGATLMSSQAAHGAQVAHGQHAVICDGHVATIVGTAGNDHLIGTDGPDVIAGLGGDDVILGLSGNDIICGGDGNDVINAMGGSGQQLFGDAGNDLCIGPGTTNSCESPRHPDPKMSDPPTGGGPNQGNVKRAQSAPVSASCSVSNGLIKLAIKGKVSAFYNNAANILVEPILFKYHSSTKTWVEKDLDVHTIKIGGYNGTFHNFLVATPTTSRSRASTTSATTSSGTRRTARTTPATCGSSTTTTQSLKGSVRNVGLCLRTCNRIRDTHPCTAGSTPSVPLCTRVAAFRRRMTRFCSCPRRESSSPRCSTSMAGAPLRRTCRHVASRQSSTPATVS